MPSWIAKGSEPGRPDHLGSVHGFLVCLLAIEPSRTEATGSGGGSSCNLTLQDWISRSNLALLGKSSEARLGSSISRSFLARSSRARRDLSFW